MSPTAVTPTPPNYFIVLDWPHALRVLEARHRRKGRQITPALLRSWAAGARDLTSRWMPDYHRR